MSLKIRDLPEEVQQALAELETTLATHETFIAAKVRAVFATHRALKRLGEEMDQSARRAGSNIRLLLRKIHRVYPSFAEDPGDLAPFDNYGYAGTTYLGRDDLPSREIDPVHRETLGEMVNELLQAEQDRRDEATV
jgi:hypothetical protein